MVGDIFVAVCLVVVFSSGCMPHGLWTQMHTHTHEWKSNCGRKFLSCYDFNAAHFYVAPCQTAHQLWWLPLTFLSPLGFLTNLVLGCRQWDMIVVETNARQRSISFKRTKKKKERKRSINICQIPSPSPHPLLVMHLCYILADFSLTGYYLIWSSARAQEHAALAV